MAQTPISDGKTPLIVSDWIKKAKAADNSLAVVSADFLTGFKTVLPSYAVNVYTGDYYNVTENSGNPTAFGTQKETLTSGKVYEIDLPADAINNGLLSLGITYSTSSSVDASKITEANEAKWDISSTNLDTVYYEQHGRKARVYLPSAYTTTPKHYESYKRYPTIPGDVADSIDIPAESESAVYSLWVQSILKIV